MSLIIAAAQSASVPGDVPRNVAHHLQIATVAAEHGVQLLVFPELSLTGYELTLARSKVVRPDSSDLDPLRHLATRAPMTVVVCAPVLNEKGQLHIAALAFCPDGSVLTYTKQHVHQSEEAVFTSGPGGPALRVEDATVALAICADAAHPEHAASAAAGGANVYAAGVMIDEKGYARKAALLQTYAREHRMAVLMANYSGVTGGEVSAGRSAIWSEDGQLVAASTGTEEALVIGTKQHGAWNGIVSPLSFPSATGSQVGPL
ncbi:MAG: carbon-nitrogen hydrolase family protein [Acidobacteriia bacterium]|nr:carbon-nitrogen hydrolase family protein [Terriglobia bacterium]